MISYLITRIALLCVYSFSPSINQLYPPITWEFQAKKKGLHQGQLIMTARLAPGWHIYSQQLKEGGPLPTRISFQSNSSFRLSGNTQERGEPNTYYDDDYEMEIIWYSGTISFVQDVQLNEATVTVRGEIEFMTCNDQVCYPSREPFSISVIQP